MEKKRMIKIMFQVMLIVGLLGLSVVLIREGKVKEGVLAAMYGICNITLFCF